MTKPSRPTASELMLRGLVPIGAAAGGALITASIQGNLPPFVVAIAVIASVSVSIFLMGMVIRVSVEPLRAWWRLRSANSQLRSDTQLAILALLDITSPAHVSSVGSILNRLHDAQLMNAGHVGFVHAQLHIVHMWLRSTHEHLSSRAVKPVAAFNSLSYMLQTYVFLCNSIVQSVPPTHSMGSADPIRSSNVASLRRDWHTIQTRVNGLSHQVVSISRRLSAQLGDDRPATHIDVVSDWP